MRRLLPACLLSVLAATTAFAATALAGSALENAKPLPKPVKIRFCLFDPMGAGGDIT
ncbi:MAG: hypothetical protein K0R03_2234, partial [Moraxellaceae bacterium]|nr:hypothetical protein [Moraxellaceae bacterium]